MSKAKEILEQMHLHEMANIRKSTTGLPVNIWASPNPGSGHSGLRIKVSNSYGNRYDPDQAFVIYFVGDEIKLTGDVGQVKAKDVEQVKMFFKEHKRAFQLFWDKQVDDDELKRLLAKAHA